MGSRSDAATEQRPEIQHATRELSAATLRVRELPADAVVTVEYRFSTAYLHSVTATFNDTNWSFSVLDPARAIVTLDSRDRDAPAPTTRRALRAALDRVGIKVTRDDRPGTRTGSQ